MPCVEIRIQANIELDLLNENIELAIRNPRHSYLALANLLRSVEDLPLVFFRLNNSVVILKTGRWHLHNTCTRIQRQKNPGRPFSDRSAPLTILNNLASENLPTQLSREIQVVGKCL